MRATNRGFLELQTCWSLPGWTWTRVQGLAGRNEDAAILATERGDIVTARLRMAENTRVGWHLMRSPLESEHYLGTRILDQANRGASGGLPVRFAAQRRLCRPGPPQSGSDERRCRTSG